jgi:hypothetical protein
MIMKLFILMLIILAGIVIPLFWLVGTVGAGGFMLYGKIAEYFNEKTIGIDPQLGMTMADGGEKIGKK